jgi:hypothetical protein
MVRMKVFITKYALTKGILEFDDAEICNSSGMIKISELGGNGYFFDKEWHRDKESAIAKAEEMRLKSIKSHEKAILKLQKMRFD